MSLVNLIISMCLIPSFYETFKKRERSMIVLSLTISRNEEEAWNDHHGKKDGTIDHGAIGGRSRESFHDHLDNVLLLGDVLLLLPPRQHQRDLGAHHALPLLLIVRVAKFANALVTAGHVPTRLAILYGATVLAARALVHVHAKAEPCRPLVSGLAALAADVDLIPDQAQKILILLSVQLALSVACENATIENIFVRNNIYVCIYIYRLLTRRLLLLNLKVNRVNETL